MSKLCDMTASVSGISEDLQNLENRLSDVSGVSPTVSAPTLDECSTAVVPPISGIGEDLQNLDNGLGDGSGVSH